MSDKIYHCTECKYTGRETSRWKCMSKTAEDFAFVCPNFCDYPFTDEFHNEGQYIPLLEYDTEDGSINGSEKDHDLAMPFITTFLALANKDSAIQKMVVTDYRGQSGLMRMTLDAMDKILQA